MTRFTGIPQFDSSVTATAELLKTGHTALLSVEVENPNTSPVYLQLFDVAATTSVTLGSTTPTVSRMVPAGAGGGVNSARLIEIPTGFTNGCVYAITTTATGAVAPTSVCLLNFTYH